LDVENNDGEGVSKNLSKHLIPRDCLDRKNFIALLDDLYTWMMTAKRY